MYRNILVLSKVPQLAETIIHCEKFQHLQASYNLKICDYQHTNNIELLKSEIFSSEILLADPSFVSPIFREVEKTDVGSLRWFQSTWAGVEQFIDAKGIANLMVTRAGGVFANQMAEYCIAYVVTEERNLNALLKAQRNHDWLPCASHRTLSSLTIGILGFGSIGKELANIFNIFGSKVFILCQDATKYEQLNKEGSLQILSGKEGLLQIVSQCDYLINVLPHTSHTVGLLNGDILKNCQPSTIFINVGRGSIIKSEDLLEALNNKWIRGAILDVFEEEPLNKNSQLWDLENVKITPHVSALSTKQDVADLFVDNLERYLKDQKLNWLVDQDKKILNSSNIISLRLAPSLMLIDASGNLLSYHYSKEA